MGERTIFFAGGGTGGHIYPAISVAEKIGELDGAAKVHFFCSERKIDSDILTKAGYEFTKLPAVGLSMSPKGLVDFVRLFLKSEAIARKMIEQSGEAVVVGVGGFVAAPVCRAAYKSGRPLYLLNVDFVPGKANKVIARWADEILVNFAQTAGYFGKYRNKVRTTGCPLRGSFEKPEPQRARDMLGLDKNKKTLLITGASTGSASINQSMCMLLGRLDGFCDSWQVVHLTGKANYEQVRKECGWAKINYKVIDYWDEMADLLAAADLVIGRSGAVSVAEYVAAEVPVVCLPYPFHKDRHQYLNAGGLVEAGAGVIVDDVADANARTENLWREIEKIMKDDAVRIRMKTAAARGAKKNSATEIAKLLLSDAAIRR